MVGVGTMCVPRDIQPIPNLTWGLPRREKQQALSAKETLQCDLILPVPDIECGACGLEHRRIRGAPIDNWKGCMREQH